LLWRWRVVFILDMIEKAEFGGLSLGVRLGRLFERFVVILGEIRGGGLIEIKMRSASVFFPRIDNADNREIHLLDFNFILRQ
jgi:hypothetical protein